MSSQPSNVPKLGEELARYFPWVLSDWEIVEQQLAKGTNADGRVLARKKVAGGHLYREEMWHGSANHRSLALAFVPDRMTLGVDPATAEAVEDFKELKDAEGAMR